MRSNNQAIGLSRALLASAPAGVMTVMANGGEIDPKKMLGELNAAFGDFKKRHEDFQAGVQKGMDDLYARVQMNTLGSPNAPVGANEPNPDPEYSRLFASYARNGSGAHELLEANRDGDRGRINSAMTVSPGESGGYLAPVEWDRQIREALRERSPLRRISAVVRTSVRGFSTLWNMGGLGSGWVGETADRPATTTPQIKPFGFSSGEIYAFPKITQQLIDDADFPVERWLSDQVAEEIGVQEDIAFVSGDGVNKPRGLLTYVPGGASATEHPGGTLAIMPSGAAAAIVPDALVDFVYSLPGSYRRNARWLMNSTTAAVIAKLKDGQGNYLWRETYVAGQPATLLGFPVEIDENMPSIAAGALPIAFGDFKRGYLINDRFGVRVLRDPFTAKPFVGFYTTKRVGGGVLDPRAIRLMRIAAS